MENPNVSGWAAKRRFRIVDFPEPEGPEITIGRCSWVAGRGEGKVIRLIYVRVCGTGCRGTWEESGPTCRSHCGEAEGGERLWGRVGRVGNIKEEFERYTGGMEVQ